MTREIDRDPFDDEGCWQCGGEGYLLGCSWDWQCDTYDAGEGACLCERVCDICNPRTPDPIAKAAQPEGVSP